MTPERLRAIEARHAKGRVLPQDIDLLLALTRLAFHDTDRIMERVMDRDGDPEKRLTEIGEIACDYPWNHNL